MHMFVVASRAGEHLNVLPITSPARVFELLGSMDVFFKLSQVAAIAVLVAHWLKALMTRGTRRLEQMMPLRCFHPAKKICLLSIAKAADTQAKKQHHRQGDDTLQIDSVAPA